MKTQDILYIFWWYWPTILVILTHPNFQDDDFELHDKITDFFSNYPLLFQFCMKCEPDDPG